MSWRGSASSDRNDPEASELPNNQISASCQPTRLPTSQRERSRRRFSISFVSSDRGGDTPPRTRHGTAYTSCESHQIPESFSCTNYPLFPVEMHTGKAAEDLRFCGRPLDSRSHRNNLSPRRFFQLIMDPRNPSRRFYPPRPGLRNPAPTHHPGTPLGRENFFGCASTTPPEQGREQELRPRRASVSWRRTRRYTLCSWRSWLCCIR